TTSGRVMKCSAVRSQTARPWRLAKGFFSLSRKRDEWPAAGRITANLAMADPFTQGPTANAGPGAAIILWRGRPGLPPVGAGWRSFARGFGSGPRLGPARRPGP